MRTAIALVVLAILSGCGDPRPTPDQHGGLTLSMRTIPIVGASLASRRVMARAREFCGPDNYVRVTRASLDELLSHVTITFRCAQRVTEAPRKGLNPVQDAVSRLIAGDKQAGMEAVGTDKQILFGTPEDKALKCVFVADNQYMELHEPLPDAAAQRVALRAIRDKCRASVGLAPIDQHQE